MKRIAFIFCLFFSLSPVYASHIVGGDISYDYLGNNQYRFYVSVYRDNLSGGAAFDSPLNFSVFRIIGNTRFADYEFTYTGFTSVPTNFNNPCGTAPTNIDTQNAIYTQVITLPPIAGGYRVAYQRCCRGPNINNLQSPDNTGLTLTIDVPGITNNNYINSSPHFTNYPPLVLCSQDDLVFNHSATDADGDDLVYSLVTPYAGGTSGNPAPNPIPAPNYPLVNWAGGFSATQALGPSASISINPTTGVINAFPTITGRYVVGIQVQEFRNGVLISTTIRDFIFQVFNCQIVLQAELPTQQELASFTSFCDGNLTIQFENNSFGGSTYHWDFGVNGITTDVSTAATPTFNYPDTGHYTVQLIANPGSACTDTAYMEIDLYNAVNISFDIIDTLCFEGNSIDIIPVTDAPIGSSFEWNFTPDGVPLTSTIKNPVGVSFATSGWKHVDVTASFAICEGTHLDSIFIIPKPIANFEMPQNYKCDGLQVDFINTSQNSTDYTWSFFNNQSSTDFEPSINFPAGGSYDVKLVTSANGSCPDSITQTLIVNELMTVSFTNSPDQCITDNLFDFIGQVTGPDHAVFTWDFGNGASVGNSNDTSVFGVNYTVPGTHTVTFTGNFDACEEVATSELFIYSSPTIGFGLVDGLQCVPWTAQFIDQSFSETPINYSWDFGDGSAVSTDSDPNHVYETPGMYVVSLTIRTDEGCIDTLFLTREDLINIFPIPDAQFSVSTEETDICHSSIYFTNESSGATNYKYWFDEGATFSTQENPGFAYSTSGYHYPYLIAYNQEGCSDTTATTRIYIEPFSVYIPNTFTPNDDGFNTVLTPQMWLTPTEWDFKIYNRWGEIVYRSTDYTESWDGNSKGLPVQDGTYQYILRYKPCSAEQGTVFLEGHINLLR